MAELPNPKGPELHYEVEYQTPNGVSVARFRKVDVYPGGKDWALELK